MAITGVVAASSLALVHVLAHRLRFLEGVPRNRLLSGFGGISVAYVTVHLFPEVARGQALVEERVAGGPLGPLDRHLYLLMLVGLVLFFGLELSARRDTGHGRRRTGPGMFTLSIASFGVYNSLVGYLVAERAEGRRTAELVTFSLALGVHFVVNDFGLRDHHEHRYQRVGRWVLAAAVVIGWSVGQIGEVSETVRVAMIAFLGGGVVLNVFKEELPEDRRSRFVPFAAGAAGYSGLLLLM
jgi:hypothetical protein